MKILVGRPKDLALIRILHATDRIDAQKVRERLESIPKDEREIARSAVNLRSALNEES